MRELDLDPDPAVLLRKWKRLRKRQWMRLWMRRFRKRLRKLDLDPDPAVLLRRRKQPLLLTVRRPSLGVFRLI